MTEHETDLNAWLTIIKGEYREMPGLQLTKSQIRRLWSLDDSVCDVLLEKLQAADFLRVTPRGCYVLADNEVDTTRTYAR